MKNLLKEIFGIKKARIVIISSIILSTIYAAINAAITSWISSAIDNANNNLAMKFSMLIILGCIATVILNYCTKMLSVFSRHFLFTEFNNRLTDKLTSVDYEFFQKYSSNYVTTVNSSLYAISRLSGTIMYFVSNIMTLTTTVIAVMVINKYLLIPIVIIYSIGGTLLTKLIKYINKIDEEFDNSKHKRNKEMQMLINGFTDVRTMCTQKYHKNRISSMNVGILDLAIKKTKMLGLASGVCEIIDGLVTICFVLISIMLIQNGVIKSAVAMSLLMYVWRLTYPLIGCMDVVSEISNITPQYNKYAEAMAYENKIIDGEIELSSFNSIIRLNNVSFAYDTTDNILSNITLDIKKGEKIGICGTSGEGKSTLLKLINRFYDVSDGSIYVDEVNIKDLTLDSLRKKIGTVHQKIYVFEGTIKDNITYGNPNASEYEIIEASKKACLYDFIQSLPDKFNTSIGVDGLKLSGGQQQRIALARIFISNPDIILLDEATSALDNESESVIQKSLKEFSDKTIITVAHRLSTIMDCDRIVVLDNHSIAEIGTHKELMDKNGIYASLVNTKN